MPIVAVALAAWESWVPLQHLHDAIGHANATARAASWASVAGPALAAVKTAGRIGWTFTDAVTLVDDVGITWPLLRVAPAVLKQAVADAVGRWRFSCIAADNNLAPVHPDIHSSEPATCVVIDGSRALRGLLGKGKPVAAVPAWGAHCRPWLASAIAGGQWPQARKATVRGWGLDSRCQLCFSAPGTLQHRRVCPATTPVGGWGDTSTQVKASLARLGGDRTAKLRSCGLLALRVPRPLAIDEPQAR